MTSCIAPLARSSATRRFFHRLPLPAAIPRAVAIACFAGIAHASHTMVTTAADETNGNLSPASGSGVSLREAILHSPPGSIVSFAPELAGVTITLSQSSGFRQITIGKNLRIEGPATGPPVTVRRTGTEQHPDF